jgi:ectoine hydroxylase-related dioxygenase (phytanoyl-CoA dioxygenase family)
MAESARIDRKPSALDRVMGEIGVQDLQPHLLELETQGFTTIPRVLSDETIETAKRAILKRVERATGRRIDPEKATADDYEGMTYLPYLLYDDEVFEEILMEPKPLALITYLLGESCLLSSMGCHFKGPGGTPLPLHSDNGNGMPPPYPAYSQVANVNYALTPYSLEAGALAMVPGSHRLARPPRPEEMVLGGPKTNPKARSMDLMPGDVVVWHGNTWHGSFARQVPGIRMNLAVYFCRQYVQSQEQHKGVVPDEVLARHANDDRFQVLLHQKQPYGWQAEGPDYALMARNPQGLYD